MVAGDQRGVVSSERPKAPGDELRRVMSDSSSGLLWILSPIAIARAVWLTPPGLSQGAWDTAPWLAAPFLRGQMHRLNPLGLRGLLILWANIH